MEPTVGIEPTTCSLRNGCSTTELRWQQKSVVGNQPRSTFPMISNLCAALCPVGVTPIRPLHVPVGPNRSVRMSASGIPSATVSLATFSTKSVGPQM